MATKLFHSLFIAAALVAPVRIARGNGADTTAAGLRSFENGRTAFDAGRYEEALGQFRASNQLLPSPNSRLYMARCFRLLKKLGSAYTQFKLAAREAQDRITTTNERRYVATRDAALAEAAEIDREVPRLTIDVDVDESARVVVKKNGVVVPREAWGIPVETDAGEVLVEAQAWRHASASERLTLRAGEQRRVKLRLSRVPTARIVLAWQTRPSGVAVELDGVPVDAAATDHDVDAGPHTVTAHAPGYTPFRWQQTLADRERREVGIALPVEPPPRVSPRARLRGLSLAAGAVGVAALGTAAGLVVDASRRNAAELAKSPYARSETTRIAIRAEATASSALFATGGVLVATAATMAWFAWRKERGSAPTVGAMVGSDGGAFIIGGRF